MLPPLINDLALILICASVTTLIFKKIKQPLVLGYIVAGVICSPHLPFTFNVIDTSNIHTLSEIGVIFLLFTLGLDFNIKKIIKNGSTAIIASSVLIFSMVFLGYLLGLSFGWGSVDSIYLGGMISMSSTTIIYKAFNDMGLMHQKFAGVVISMLIIEDLLAIIMMLMLSTMAASSDVSGLEMVNNIVRLFFFVILWFVIGIYLIPILLKYVRSIVSNETLLIISLGLCFGMTVLASNTGFSAAFGAFIMGSVLSETIEAEQIEKLIEPIKDLFGAIFFVSVGMMVDPAMILVYKWQIIIITLFIILGRGLFGITGVLLSGQPLKVAMQCGFSLMQIGEFAFIIAALGTSLKVTSPFLYPIVVSVSVITTFLTPYLIKSAVPLYNFIDNKLPSNIKLLLNGYTKYSQNINKNNLWKSFFTAILKITIVYSVLCIGIIVISFQFIQPILRNYLNNNLADILSLIITISCMAPFLRALVMKKNHSKEFKKLWRDNRFNRAPLISILLLRAVIAIGLILFVIEKMYAISIAITIGIAIVVVSLVIVSRWLKKKSISLERVFYNNLRIRETHDRYIGKKHPDYESHLLSRDIHIIDYNVLPNSLWVGKSLKELNLAYRFNIHIISIIRRNYRINIPGGKEKLFPDDVLQVIGSDAELTSFVSSADKSLKFSNVEDTKNFIMELVQIPISNKSILIGKSIKESGIRDIYKCLIVGIEDALDGFVKPRGNYVLEKNDILWVVGEKNNLNELLSKVTDLEEKNRSEFDVNIQNDFSIT